MVEAAAGTGDSGISYLGRLPYEQLPGVIAHCVASTSPQYTPDRGDAGFSALKLYESMACGVPVIGSDYPGVGDVIRCYDCGIACHLVTRTPLRRPSHVSLVSPTGACDGETRT